MGGGVPGTDSWGPRLPWHADRSTSRAAWPRALPLTGYSCQLALVGRRGVGPSLAQAGEKGWLSALCVAWGQTEAKVAFGL